MNIPSVLRKRFEAALNGLVEEPAPYLEMIRSSQEPKFGDYQANMAMSLGKKLGKPPREVAQMIVDRLDVAEICTPPEIAGPGFINLTLKKEWLIETLTAAKSDRRTGVGTTESPRTILIDFSGPNVAKPMHVGHIRSTVIGNALAKMLRFYGHRVITDNHLGDWGTQFGMIIYGYRNFLSRESYLQNPLEELARLYRLVRQLMDYHKKVTALPEYQDKANFLKRKLDELERQPDQEGLDRDTEKSLKKERQRLESQIFAMLEEIQTVAEKIKSVVNDPVMVKLSQEHARIGEAVLEETSKLHHGDAENRRLWSEILVFCRQDIERIYNRLGITFDHSLGESFYNDMLPGLVTRLLEQGIARETEGAVGIFLPGREVPMLIRKKDGAFLYATTDLATIEYRVKTFQPDTVLYVVDFRQSLHFEQFFAAAGQMGYHVELIHVKFGTILGEDGTPFKTRSGDTVDLESLLDEAEKRACDIVTANDTEKTLSREQIEETAGRIGIGAMIYADLSQNRESDYVFSYDKMLAMNGNTATYLQYAYARVRSLFTKGAIDAAALRDDPSVEILLTKPVERELALQLLKFEETLELALRDYRPNLLAAYLYELANVYSSFFERCPVLKAESAVVRNSRLVLSDLTARILRQGLELLGIQTVEKM
ncbi:MAG: arginine--tRNA ligase [Planctomycetaceae bacterium]|jgi:arginyl-tRNA synthetase|nr:arginine--tRNA ligase [Planctomycetaceae bacterium]